MASAPANWPAMIEWLTDHVKPLGQKLKAEFHSTGAYQEEVEYRVIGDQ